MFIDENETPETLWVSAVLNAIRAVALVFDILTFPIHLLWQRPWRKRALSRRIKARVIQTTSDSITVQSVSGPGELHVRLVRDGVLTMESMLRAATERYASRRCLGTRTVLGEEDEPQANGRVFKKFNMGDFVWRSYTDVEREARQFAGGLRELGCRPRENVAMFAETRAEWMVAAHGCFKLSIPVVTIYATLGDEAIAHGINETEVSTVITTYDLLPKFKTILAKTPKVDTIIYMEDQLKKVDNQGYKPGIRIIGYKEVVQKGSNINFDCIPPSPSDTAIIMYTSGSTGVPKGVILSHRNMLATLKAFADAVPVYEDDILMGFLPLAHVFELLAESLCIFGGVPIGYSTPLTMLDSSSKIMKGTSGDATVLKPTCLTTVPLIMDRISKGITEKVSRSGPFASAFFKWAYSYKQTWLRRGYDTPILNRIVFSKILQLLGGRLRLLLAGGAPLAPDTHQQMHTCLCCDVVAGYGLTETTSCATVMDAHDRSTGRVGAPTAGTRLRLLDWTEGHYRVTNKPFPQVRALRARTAHPTLRTTHRTLHTAPRARPPPARGCACWTGPRGTTASPTSPSRRYAHYAPAPHTPHYAPHTAHYTPPRGRAHRRHAAAPAGLDRGALPRHQQALPAGTRTTRPHRTPHTTHHTPHTTHRPAGAPTAGTRLRLLDWTEGHYRVTNKPFPQVRALRARTAHPTLRTTHRTLHTAPRARPPPARGCACWTGPRGTTASPTSPSRRYAHYAPAPHTPHYAPHTAHYTPPRGRAHRRHAAAPAGLDRGALPRHQQALPAG
ncbi:acyl-CoA synthetase long-chain isoform 1-T2 [Aphomia sociella]